MTLKELALFKHFLHYRIRNPDATTKELEALIDRDIARLEKRSTMNRGNNEIGYELM